MNFDMYSDEHLKAIFRIAKNPKKGLRPFFANPYELIALRNVMKMRGLL